MKKVYVHLAVLFSVMFSMTIALTAQTIDINKKKPVYKTNLSGPRVGLTYVFDKSKMAKELKTRGIRNVISQFGWHFEQTVTPKLGGPSFLMEFIPLIAAVEYGTLIPSASFLLGLRFENGFEFGLGPNVLIGGDDVFNTSLILAIGISFDYGGVQIPVNLALSTSPEGERLSLVFGYAMED